MTHVVCLFEHSGMAAQEWAFAGYDVYCYDIQHEGETIVPYGRGTITFAHWDALNYMQYERMVARHKGKAIIVLGFPPCTDLAVSGAAWFKRKKEKNPLYREQAMAMVRIVDGFAEDIECEEWATENPVSVISSQWRKPNFIFNPYEYGGYLPEDDVHPVWPEYIEPRDGYTKKTCLWTNDEFVMPEKKPVPYEAVGGRSKQDRKLFSSNPNTKNIRSMGPRGFFRALFLCRHENLSDSDPLK